MCSLLEFLCFVIERVLSSKESGFRVGVWIRLCEELCFSLETEWSGVFYEYRMRLCGFYCFYAGSCFKVNAKLREKSEFCLWSSVGETLIIKRFLLWNNTKITFWLRHFERREVNRLESAWKDYLKMMALKAFRSVSVSLTRFCSAGLYSTDEFCRRTYAK